MTISDSNSPMRRMAIAIGTALAVMAVAASIYIFLVSKPTETRFNGAVIVAAASAYTRDLQARKQPIPTSVTLDDLAAQHFLKPNDIAAFHGLKASVALRSETRDPRAVLMRVHFPDGSDVVLLGDGTVQQVAR